MRIGGMDKLSDKTAGPPRVGAVVHSLPPNWGYYSFEAVKLWYETLHEAETAGASDASKPSNILLHLATDKQNQASWEGGQQNG